MTYGSAVPHTKVQGQQQILSMHPAGQKPINAKTETVKVNTVKVSSLREGNEASEVCHLPNLHLSLNSEAFCLER